MSIVTGKNLFVITGEKGTGKSTVCRKVITSLQDKGVKIAGILTFKADDSGLIVENIKTNQQEVLASIETDCGGPRVGKYLFNPAGLSFGMQAIEEGIDADILFVDELGHLEVRGEGFALAVMLVNRRKRISVVVIRQELLSSLLPQFRVLPVMFETTIDNRNELALSIAHRLIMNISRKGY